jgi:hypothetical protein
MHKGFPISRTGRTLSAGTGPRTLNRKPPNPKRTACRSGVPFVSCEFCASCGHFPDLPSSLDRPGPRSRPIARAIKPGRRFPRHTVSRPIRPGIFATKATKCTKVSRSRGPDGLCRPEPAQEPSIGSHRIQNARPAGAVCLSFLVNFVLLVAIFQTCAPRLTTPGSSTNYQVGPASGFVLPCGRESLNPQRVRCLNAGLQLTNFLPRNSATLRKCRGFG